MNLCLGILDLKILEFLLVFILGILEFPTMSSPSPFGGSLYGILDYLWWDQVGDDTALVILEFLGNSSLRNSRIPRQNIPPPFFFNLQTKQPADCEVKSGCEAKIWILV